MCYKGVQQTADISLHCCLLHKCIPTPGSVKLQHGLSSQPVCFPPLKVNLAQKTELPPLHHHNKYLANMTIEVKRCSASLTGTSVTSILWGVERSFLSPSRLLRRTSHALHCFFFPKDFQLCKFKRPPAFLNIDTFL